MPGSSSNPKSKRAVKKPKVAENKLRILAEMNADSLGFLVALCVAWLVMLLGMLCDVAGTEVVFRMIIAFAVTWCTAFVAILLMRRIAESEVGSFRQEQEQQRPQEDSPVAEAPPEVESTEQEEPDEGTGEAE